MDTSALFAALVEELERARDLPAQVVRQKQKSPLGLAPRFHAASEYSSRRKKSPDGVPALAVCGSSTSASAMTHGAPCSSVSPVAAQTPVARPRS